MVDKKNKSKRKRLVKKLDKIVSEIVRERDKKCVVCGSEEKLTNGHIFTRVSFSTRWDTEKDGNCHTQCWGCNFYHGRDKWPYFKWYIDKFGLTKFEHLRARHEAVKFYKTFELEELYLKLKEKKDIKERGY